MKIRTITPVHVGSGDKYLAVDFTVEDKKVVFIDALKFFEEVESRGYNPFEVAEEIGKGASIKDYVDISKVKRKEVPFTGKTVRREILEHIKSGEELYIPGSTIKGAVRTVLLWKAVKDDVLLLQKAIESVKRALGGKNYLHKKELVKLDDYLERLVFRKSKLLNKDDPKNDLLRALRITDTTPLDKCRIYEVKFLGMRNFSQTVECIDAGASAELEMAIDEYTLSFLSEKLDFDGIRDAAREFAEEIVKTESARNYPEEAKREFRNVLRSDGIILRVGWGTGWYSSTIGTLLKTHPEFEKLRKNLGLGRNPKTKRFSRNFPLIRRITFDNKPLGWISIHE